MCPRLSLPGKGNVPISEARNTVPERSEQSHLVIGYPPYIRLPPSRNARSGLLRGRNLYDWATALVGRSAMLTGRPDRLLYQNIFEPKPARPGTNCCKLHHRSSCARRAACRRAGSRTCKPTTPSYAYSYAFMHRFKHVVIMCYQPKAAAAHGEVCRGEAQQSTVRSRTGLLCLCLGSLGLVRHPAADHSEVGIS